jgi:hypothetical protein
VKIIALVILTIYDYDFQNFRFHKQVQRSVSVGVSFKSNFDNIAVTLLLYMWDMNRPSKLIATRPSIKLYIGLDL